MPTRSEVAAAIAAADEGEVQRLWAAMQAERADWRAWDECSSVTSATTWRAPKITPLPWQRELGLLCDRLVDSAIAGSGLRATLAAPPRHGKTEWTGLGMPIRAYLAAARAGRSFSILYVTSTSQRADEVSARVRSAIARLHRETGEQCFAPGPIWTRTEWETLGGLRWTAMGWSGATGGIGAHLLILDDVIGTSEVYRSSTTRGRIRRVIEEDLLSRLMDGGSALQMETRRGTEDTTAWLTSTWPGTWEAHVWRCWEAERGYLWPEQYGEAWRATMPHLTDSSAVWRALYQQEPVAEGGTLIPYDWTTATYAEDPRSARALADHVVAGVDLAATGRTTSDEYAIVVIGCRGAYRDVLHVVVGRAGYVEQRARLRDVCLDWRPDAVILELAAGGDAMLDELGGEIRGLRGERARGDKVTRLSPHLPRFAARQVRTPAGGAPWVPRWREQVSGFSGVDGEADDIVDGTVWALHGAESQVMPTIRFATLGGAR